MSTFIVSLHFETDFNGQEPERRTPIRRAPVRFTAALRRIGTWSSVEGREAWSVIVGFLFWQLKFLGHKMMADLRTPFGSTGLSALALVSLDATDAQNEMD